MARLENKRVITYKRNKRVRQVYAIRAIVVAVFLAVVVLMGCGGVYIYERIFGMKQVAASPGQTEGTEDADITLLDAENAAEASTGEVPETGAGENAGQNSKETEDDGWKVIVDAGHGGNDVGANSGDIYEKNINLNMALLVAELLEAEGVEVVMTREIDDYLSLEERVEISNEEEPDLFVSLHCNTYEDDSSVHGMDCYYAEGREDGAFYAEHIMEVIESYGDVRSRGVKEEDFYVTEFNEWPAVLIEMGFLTNPAELKKLNSADFQKLLAEELAEGILQGLKASAAE